MIFKAKKEIELLNSISSEKININCAGRCNINEWGGKKTPQIFIDNIEIKESSLYDF